MRNFFWRLFTATLLVAGLVAGLAGTAKADVGFATPEFEQVWNHDDLAVKNGQVHDRTWTWGNLLGTGQMEPYKEAPNGQRLVQYFDKSRMEINDPNGDKTNQWYVTNGLLVTEMATGKLQLGNDTFLTCKPANIPVAGDMNQDTSKATTYGTFWNSLKPAGEYPVGKEFQEWLPTSYYKDSWLYVIGKPISPAWSLENVMVGGTPKRVVVQLFERRVLTYTPSNPDPWKVEMGNVGMHYMQWRQECLKEANGPTTSSSIIKSPYGTITQGFEDGWVRLIAAKGGKNCAWSFRYILQAEGAVNYEWTDCVNLKLSGSGTIKLWLKPDAEGYGNQELAWWPKETTPIVNMSVLSLNGQWTGLQPVKNFSTGINFASNVDVRRMEIQLNNSVLEMPLGTGHGAN